MAVLATRAEIIDYSIPYGDGIDGLLLPLNLKKRFDFWAYFNMFQPAAWLGTAIITSIAAFAIFLIKWSGLESLYPIADSEEFTFINAFAAVCTYLIHRPHDFKPLRLSSRLKIHQMILD